jgi:broad specificity phosphatase PhoE
MADTRPELVLIRHGETEWSKSRHHTGRTDIPLTEHGRQQAVHIADAIGTFDFTRVFASPLTRAWETAELIGLEPTADDNLLEWDYGKYEGTTTAETRKEIPGWSVWTHPIIDGESIEDVGLRTDALIERMLCLEGPIALVAHAHILRILGARWIGLPPVEGRRFTLDTTTISILGWERENRAMLRWNDPCGWG